MKKIVGYFMILTVTCLLFGTSFVQTALAVDDSKGAIREKWLLLGGADGILGAPLTSLSDEIPTADGGCWADVDPGRYVLFQGGAIYWSERTGAHAVTGVIYDKWKSVGAEKSSFGYPASDVLPTSDGRGRYMQFQCYSRIYWSSETSAHKIGGLILKTWLGMGAEKSYLGYPISDEIPFTIRTYDTLEEGVYTKFQGGSLHWTPMRGAYVATIQEDTARLPIDIFKPVIIPPYKQLCCKPN